MKKIFVISLLAIIYLLGCEESFSPVDEPREKFVFYSVLNADTSYQTAVISKSYVGDGIDPLSNTTDPSIEGADVRLWDGNNVYFLKDSSIESSDQSRYNSPFKYYYLKDYRPIYNSDISIEVLLPNGKRIRSESKVPDSVSISANSDRVIPVDNRSSSSIAWTTTDKNVWFVTQLTITYFEVIDGNRVRFEKKIPLDIINVDGTEFPIYPKPTSQTGFVLKDVVLNKIMNNISESGLEKQNYWVRNRIKLEIVVLDKNLASYYQSNNDVLDGFSVRLNQSDYSNIENGIGLFASFVKQTTELRLRADYIESFGYTETSF